MSARSRVTDIPPRLREIVDERTAALDEPFVGLTIDGVRRTDLFDAGPSGVSTEPIAEAARTFLAALTDEQRRSIQFPIDAAEWRRWINVHMNFFRHGVMLESLSSAARRLGLALLQATLSARGYGLARDIMRMNEFLAELTGSLDEYGQWPYFLSIFGDPSSGDPWGWQLDGHHLNVNCMVVEDRVVMTPLFMGSEPCQVHEGRYAGMQLFVAEERTGLDLMRSLDERQRGQAILRPSISPDDLPLELQQPFDGRMQGGAFQDNVVIAAEGVVGSDLDDAQRRRLLNLVATYVGWNDEGHAETRMAEVAAHIDETNFCWMGSVGDDGPFYYRVLSPVVLIEFDHHPGVVFDNSMPSRNHIHTVVRTPNGGDYGADLLRQHHERFDHDRGHHQPRA